MAEIEFNAKTYETISESIRSLIDSLQPFHDKRQKLLTNFFVALGLNNVLSELGTPNSLVEDPVVANKLRDYILNQITMNTSGTYDGFSMEDPIEDPSSPMNVSSPSVRVNDSSDSEAQDESSSSNPASSPVQPRHKKPKRVRSPEEFKDIEASEVSEGEESSSSSDEDDDDEEGDDDVDEDNPRSSDVDMHS